MNAFDKREVAPAWFVRLVVKFNIKNLKEWFDVIDEKKILQEYPFIPGNSVDKF